jgi:hypothetical protein
MFMFRQKKKKFSNSEKKTKMTQPLQLSIAGTAYVSLLLLQDWVHEDFVIRESKRH